MSDCIPTLLGNSTKGRIVRNMYHHLGFENAFLARKLLFYIFFYQFELWKKQGRKQLFCLLSDQSSLYRGKYMYYTSHWANNRTSVGRDQNANRTTRLRRFFVCFSDIWELVSSVSNDLDHLNSITSVCFVDNTKTQFDSLEEESRESHTKKFPAYSYDKGLLQVH